MRLDAPAPPEPALPGPAVAPPAAPVLPFPPVRGDTVEPRPAPVPPAEPPMPAGSAPGSVQMRAALSELVAAWDALPDPTPEDRAALWAMRGELRRLRTLEAYLNGCLPG